MKVSNKVRIPLAFALGAAAAGATSLVPQRILKTQWAQFTATGVASAGVGLLTFPWKTQVAAERTRHVQKTSTGGNLKETERKITPPLLQASILDKLQGAERQVAQAIANTLSKPEIQENLQAVLKLQGVKSLAEASFGQMLGVLSGVGLDGNELASIRLCLPIERELRSGFDYLAVTPETLWDRRLIDGIDDPSQATIMPALLAHLRQHSVAVVFKEGTIWIDSGDYTSFLQPLYGKYYDLGENLGGGKIDLTKPDEIVITKNDATELRLTVQSQAAGWSIIHSVPSVKLWD